MSIRNAMVFNSMAMAALTGTAIPLYAGNAYVGVSLGREQTVNHDVDAARLGLTPPSSIDSAGDIPRKFFGGYQFNDYFALEGGYFNVGGVSASGTSVVSGSPQSIMLETAGWDFMGVGILPLGAGFSLFGKFGIYTSNSEATYAPVLAGEVSHIFESTDIMAGAGVSWEFTAHGQRFGLRGEWERFTKAANNATYTAGVKDGNGYDIDLVTLGAYWKF